jgi:anti-sigma-K factor RskA/putative zinc finger protein
MSEHPDLVEWALGQLGSEDELALEAHLRTCPDCRATADELLGAHVAMRRAAPPIEVPPGLEARVLPPPRRRVPRALWGLVPLAAAAAAAVFLFAGGGPAGRQLRSTTGERVDVTAVVRVTPVGREVVLDIDALRDPRPDGLYQLWFVAPDDTRRRPHRVSAGTFHPDADGRGEVRLLAAADPKVYPRLSITLQAADGDPRTIGPEVLR